MTSDELRERVMRLLNENEKQLIITKIAGCAIGAYERLPKDIQTRIKEELEEAEDSNVG